MNATTAATPGRFVYTGRSTNWLVVIVSVLLLVPLLLGSKAGFDVGAFIGIGVAAVLLATGSSVRTTAGPAGVTVHFGVFGWPRFRFGRERVATAEVVHVPAQWAWGPWWTPRRGWLLTVGEGPALRLTLTNGRRVTVGMPDPAAAREALGV